MEEKLFTARDMRYAFMAGSTFAEACIDIELEGDSEEEPMDFGEYMEDAHNFEVK